MKAHFFEYWSRLRSSFWFVPGIMTGAAIALALATVALDESVTAGNWLSGQSWAYSGGAEGASLLLSTIAGSMITITGVVFSMTLVALSLASSQLGPRLLRSFMRDTKNQVALGTFVATFVYCLLTLRTIRRADDLAFVPHLSVTVAVLLALVSLAVLIYFIHHVSISIQADEVVARLHTELIKGIDRLFPQDMEHEAARPAGLLDGPQLPPTFEREARPVAAAEDGYIQSIDVDALMELAIQQDAVFRLERRPGQYAVAGCPLVTVWPGKRVTGPFEEQISSSFVVGRQRTATQDIEFVINQLVEIAVRALSPGISDPFTAISCVDRLGSVLHRLAQLDMPSPLCLDQQNRLRLVLRAATFREIVDASFGTIRQYAQSTAVVPVRLLETIAVVAGATHRPDDRTALLRQAEMIVRGAREAFSEDEDRRAVEECYRDAKCAIRAAGSRFP